MSIYESRLPQRELLPEEVGGAEAGVGHPAEPHDVLQTDLCVCVCVRARACRTECVCVFQHGADP